MVDASLDRQSTAMLKLSSRGLDLVASFAGKQRKSFLKDLAAAETLVRNAVTVPLFLFEYEALVSLMFDCGPGRKASADDLGYDGIVTLASGRPSSILLDINRGNYDDAAERFTQWRDPGSPNEVQNTRQRIAEELTFRDLPWKTAVAGIVQVPTEAQMTEILAIAEEEARNARAAAIVATNQPAPPRAKPVFAPKAANTFDDVMPSAGPRAKPGATQTIIDSDAGKGDSSSKDSPTRVAAPAAQPAPQPAPAAAPPAPPPASPIKDFLRSRRGWGQIFVTGAHLLQLTSVVSVFGPNHFVTHFARVYGAVVVDPQLLDLAVSFALFITSWPMLIVGGWVRAWGEKHARHPLGTPNEAAVARRVVAELQKAA